MKQPTDLSDPPCLQDPSVLTVTQSVMTYNEMKISLQHGGFGSQNGSDTSKATVMLIVSHH